MRITLYEVPEILIPFYTAVFKCNLKHLEPGTVNLLVIYVFQASAPITGFALLFCQDSVLDQFLQVNIIWVSCKG